MKFPSLRLRGIYFIATTFALATAALPAVSRAEVTKRSAPPAKPATRESSAASVEAFLHKNFDGKQWGMVVALVDEQGTRVFSAGGMGNGTQLAVDGNTVFEIGSITKTFTVLLLQDMVERGAMKLDDPVSSYLPDSVHMPSFHGTPITLLHLAEQTSGLPFEGPDNTLPTPRPGDNPWAEYTVDKMYAFLNGYTLPRTPGESFGYSNIGMGVLGHVITRKAGIEYEPLLIDRVCGALHMDDTRVALTADLQRRLATGHNSEGAAAPNWDIHAIVAAGGLRSTANDLAKYVAAEAGLNPSPLTPLMERTHALRHKADPIRWGNTAMPWYDMGAYCPPGTRMLGHGGGTGGYASFVGFDTVRRRGVVVLSNQTTIHSTCVGWRIMQGARLDGIDPTKLQPVREIVGAGLDIAPDPAGHGIRVVATRPGSPAADAGIAANSLVKSIDGVSTDGKSLADCMSLIRGVAGTRVQLALASKDDPTQKSIELTRRAFFIDE